MCIAVNAHQEGKITIESNRTREKCQRYRREKRKHGIGELCRQSRQRKELVGKVDAVEEEVHSRGGGKEERPPPEKKKGKRAQSSSLSLSHVFLSQSVWPSLLMTF